MWNARGWMSFQINLGHFWGTFQNKSPSTAVVYENAVTLFCCEAPGTTSRLYQTFHRHVSEQTMTEFYFFGELLLQEMSQQRHCSCFALFFFFCYGKSKFQMLLSPMNWFSLLLWESSRPQGAEDGAVILSHSWRGYSSTGKFTSGYIWCKYNCSDSGGHKKGTGLQSDWPETQHWIILQLNIMQLLLHALISE